MKFSMSRYIPILAASARRAAAIVGLGLLGLTAILPHAHAQSPNDITQPMPYSWPMFHAGGTSPGTFATGGFNPSPNLLMGQLQGTPSGPYTNPATGVTMLTQTPSFLLGNYQPTLPPVSQTTFFPNNFRDSVPFGILSWSAPFTFLIPSAALSDPNALQVDDTTDDPGTLANPNVTLTPSLGAWQNAGAYYADGTATHQEYLQHSVIQGTTATATATWTLTAPTGTSGFYAVAFHIPDLPLNGAPPRIQDAHYVVRSNGQTLDDVHVSQTDANAVQTLAGPFFLASGQTVTVTLDNTTAEDPTNKVVIADSLTLQPGFGADTQGQPTAVNVTQYPEIQNALYYGVLPANDPLRSPPNTVAYNGDASLPDTLPRGNPTEGTLNPDPNRRIRQLVYFGRSENIILQDASGNLVDANNNSVTKPVVQTVGAIYCVDGFTGSVVWRYQTPTVAKTNADGTTTALPSAPVFSTPAVARINVITKITGAGQNRAVYYATKLVVIVGDDNGLVYCLDALGNRNGTCNSASVSANSQPIFNPTAGLNNVTTPRAHVGTTPVYWVYRPDPANPIRDGLVTPVTAQTPAVPERDLPVPQAFGLASPTVYVNPSSSVSTNAVGLPPSNPGVANSKLKSNATVYIGNSNGTLYSLDALGGVTDTDTTDTLNQPLFNLPRPIGELGPVNSPTTDLTCSVNWWYAVNGTATNDSSNDNNATIESAPAIWETDGSKTLTGPVTQTSITPNAPIHIYFTTGNDSLNEGRLYSVLSTGPVDQSGAAFAPGSANYNVDSEPDWAFPQVEHQVQPLPNTADKTRPPLGSMTGSPVVFLNPHILPPPPTPPALNTFSTPTIYFAAASGVEEQGADRPGVEETGRIWSVDAVTGAMNWAYPTANDPNTTDFAYDPNSTTTSPPLGTFRNVTPAIGMVQFPNTIVYGANVPYTHSDSLGDVKGRDVPMLYAGSGGVGAGQLGPRFYGIDLDATVNTSTKAIDETQATIFQDETDPTDIVPGIASPGDLFNTSPALIVNSSTTGGNGGALFVAAGSTLYQIDATPETNQDTTSTQPLVATLALDAGYGPITSPSVAAADVQDLEILTGTLTARVPQATDWVYFGDRGLGITFGITPKNQGNGVGATLGSGVVPPNNVNPPVVLQQFPLYSYLFDGTAAHPGGVNVPPGATATDSQDMRKANPIGGDLPIFEWGQNVYIRIGNVIPPYPVADSSHWVPDPNSASSTDPDNPPVIYADGGPVSIQISEYDPTSRRVNQTDTGQVPATVLPALPGNGFIGRTDPYTNGQFIHPNENLIDTGGPGDPAATPPVAASSPTGWIAAYTYAVRDGSGRKNTPGSTRRVINAVQTAKAYKLVTTTDINGVKTTTPVFLQSVTLQTTVTAGGRFTRNIVRNPDGSTASGTIGTISAVDQPTFALLNPLALHGGGVPLFGPNGGSVQQIGEVVGPFAGVHQPSSATDDDLPAYTNGNRTYRSPTDIPKSGVRGAGRANARLRFRRVTTVAGEINHGTTGDNAAPNPPGAPIGNITNGTPGNGGLTDPKAFGEYMLDIADRSVLGLHNQHLQVTMESHNAHWNDNSGAGGPGAVINPLPWERLPAATGPNSTPDYPNIPRSNVTQVIQPNNPNNAAGIGGPATNQAVVPDPATAGSGDESSRNVLADPVQVKIIVPRYQPANLQLYDQDGGLGATYITPQNAVKTHDTYPMGYVSRRQRIYVDSNHNHQYDDGEAYRYLNTYVGVPVDMNTTIETSTVDLGKLPQSLGVQTNAFTSLDAFAPYRTSAQVATKVPGFVNFFKPLDIRNRGNVNLLNVHLDQKLIAANVVGNTLPFVSDALDSKALIPAYDYNGITGQDNSGNPLQPYLLRSSLDSDLVAAFGRIKNSGAVIPAYPNATFHKTRVGAAQPAQLTVPDVPSDNNAAFAGAGFNLAPAGLLPPAQSNSGLLANADPASPFYGKPAASVPYIGLTVPLGTPVGTYSQRVQLFEGIDPTGYNDIGQGSTYTPLMPPKYTQPNDTWLADVVRTGSTPTVVKATVTETRVTDNTSYGTLPQVDAALSQPIVPAGGGAPTYRAASDFQPSAYRDLFWNGATANGSGNLGLIWTTSRGFTSAATPPYNVAGATLVFNKGAGYFESSALTGNTLNPPRWWQPMGTNNGLLFTNTVAPPNGTNTGMTFAPDQQLPDGSGKFISDGSVYAFAQNTIAVPGAGNQSQIFCFPVSGGVVSTTSPILVTRDPGPAKSGVRGLKFSNTTFSDPFNAPGTINNNLWAFWSGGARNRAAISYSSADTTGANGPTFGKSAVLPIPAGLTSVSDPSATLIYVPQAATTKPIPAIEVTYTGIAPDGNADIYVSRYQPYYVRDAQNNPTAQVGLALISSPLINEQLQADPGNLYWQARDVGWLRSGALQVNISLSGVTTGPYATGNYVNVLQNKTPTFDRATNTLAYTNIQLPDAAGNPKLGTVYVDLSRGRVRFSPALPNNAAVFSTFYAQARRITTDSRADTVPVAFLDPTYKPNEAPGGDRVPTDRYWYIWRKSGSSGTSTTPTLYYKTQRLTLDLQFPPSFTGIQLDPNGKPKITVTVNGTTVYTGAGGGPVDVDWKRGRVYFPMVFPQGGPLAGQVSEGQFASATFTSSAGGSTTASDTIHWLDELRLNDNPPARQGINTTKFPAVSTSETAIPIDTITNESNVSAFLDPLAFGNVAGGAYDLGGNLGANANQPHKIWLFWNSTRNGTADIYYETIEPKFSSVPGG